MEKIILQDVGTSQPRSVNWDLKPKTQGRRSHGNTSSRF